jgi:hypothetical protein
MTITLKLPVPTVLLNEWQRMHWAVRRRYTQRMSWYVRLAGRPPVEPFEKCRICIQRLSAGRMPDKDGLYGGVKPLLDCLVIPSRRHPHGLGFIRDDGPDVVLDLEVVAERVPRTEAGTIVTIEAAWPDKQQYLGHN